MFCRKCGAQNEDSAKFCKKCGEKLVKITYENQPIGGNQEAHNNSKAGKKTGKTIAVIVALILILAALVLAGVFALKTRKAKQYADAMDRGQKYLEELDYESAEAEFLEALSIDPKEPEPYLVLSDLYLAQDEPEKAIEILEQAAENVPKAVQKEMEESGQKDIGKKLEEVKKLEKYTWVVEPEIEADDIFYVWSDGSDDCYDNDIHRQAMMDYAVIKRGNSFGVIGYNGKVIGEIAYEAIRFYYGTYILSEPIGRNTSQNWSNYSLEDGQISTFVGMGTKQHFNVFYYYNGIQNLGGSYQPILQGVYRAEPEHPVPVQQTEKVFVSPESSGDYYFGMEGLSYALYADGKLVTDFDYEDMGSLGEELVAVKKDGKWGYLNEKGETVIPIEYDGSWTIHPMSDDGEETAYAYADSDGYVTLCKDGKWELRNTKGALVIMPGVFEKICPVYDGKCWVKRNGKWGVIALEGKEKSEESEKKDTDSKTEKIEEAETRETSEMTVAEICQKIAEHYNEVNNTDVFVVFESECIETEEGYMLLLRSTGTNVANKLIGSVTVNIKTGEVTDEWGDTWTL